MPSRTELTLLQWLSKRKRQITQTTRTNTICSCCWSIRWPRRKTSTQPTKQWSLLAWRRPWCCLMPHSVCLLTPITNSMPICPQVDNLSRLTYRRSSSLLIWTHQPSSLRVVFLRTLQMQLSLAIETLPSCTRASALAMIYLSGTIPLMALRKWLHPFLWASNGESKLILPSIQSLLSNLIVDYECMPKKSAMAWRIRTLSWPYYLCLVSMICAFYIIVFRAKAIRESKLVYLACMSLVQLKQHWFTKESIDVTRS